MNGELLDRSKTGTGSDMIRRDRWSGDEGKGFLRFTDVGDEYTEEDEEHEE